ncbi:MAG: hypothetical protein ACPG4E_02435 [Flavobacteriaceae bacterium]
MNVQCLTLCALCFCIGLQSHGQLKIGGDPYQIHPYALLELESSERALVLPRLSTAERDRSFTHSIPVGMVFFNTDTQQLEVWTQNKEWAVLSYISSDTQWGRNKRYLVYQEYRGLSYCSYSGI